MAGFSMSTISSPAPIGAGAGFGGALLDRLKQEAAELRCDKLVLDTPMSNFLGHRFYFRQGLLAKALRFSFDRTAG
ncbi:MAG TPA: hypothetical protein VN715_20415 [Roseiarcus sp.]|nr:hypothetical protein [Roseiarcus sp.]